MFIFGNEENLFRMRNRDKKNFNQEGNSRTLDAFIFAGELIKVF